MPYIIGIVVAVGIALFANLVKFDRRTFYSTVLIVVAHYYVLFAAMSGSIHTVLVESALMLVFVSAAVVGFRSNIWIVVAALAAHGIQDAFHSGIIVNTGVPVWWPAFCATYDVGAAAILACLILATDKRRVTP